jgi:hypothetical protein
MQITLTATYKPCLNKQGEVYPDYFVSEHGEVLSTKRGSPRVLNLSTACSRKDRKNGQKGQKGMYRLAILQYSGKLHPEYVHVLTARSWIGMEPFPDATVNHKDLNKRNNEFTNLEWMTRKENNRHAWDNGACVPTTKLTPVDVLAARTIRKEEKHSYREIRDRLGLSVSTDALRTAVIGETNIFRDIGGDIPDKKVYEGCRRRFTPKDVEDAIRMRTEGRTLKAIAEHKDTTINVVWYAINKARSAA